MIIRHPCHPSHPCYDPGSISQTFLEHFFLKSFKVVIFIKIEEFSSSPPNEKILGFVVKKVPVWRMRIERGIVSTGSCCPAVGTSLEAQTSNCQYLSL